MRTRIGFCLLLGIGLAFSTGLRSAIPSEAAGPDDPLKSAEAGEKPAFRVVTLEGKAVLYRDAMKERLGIEWADDRAAELLAFETTDGQLLTLFPNEAARFFYNDARVRNRPMRVTGRIYEKAPGLVTLSFLSIVDGKPNEIYYWCNVCAIKSFADADCACCQGPVELREHPVGESHRYKNADSNAASSGGQPSSQVGGGKQ